MTKERLDAKELIGMTVIIGAMPDSHWEQLTPLLEQLGWRAPQARHPEDWYQTPEAVQDSPSNNRYLLLHARPEIIIASAMHAGKSPVESLNQWRASAQYLLSFYKRNRRQSILLEVDSVWKYPQRCLESVSSHFGFEVKGEANNLDATEEAPSQCQLLANQFFVQSSLPSNIMPELQACTFPLDDKSYTAPTLDVAELYQEFLTSNKTETASAEALMDSQEENALMLEQLHRVQEELEVYYMKSKSRDSDKEENRKLKEEAKKMTSKFQESNKKLQNNNRSVREARESNKKLKKSLEKTNRELRHAQTAIEQLKNSTSWKITAPIRRMKMAVFRKK